MGISLADALSLSPAEHALWEWHFRELPPLCLMVAAWMGIGKREEPEEDPEVGSDWIREDMVRRATANAS